MNWSTLVSAETLASALGQPGLVLVDCRHALADAEAGERAYRAAHLPGAGFAHLDRDLSDHTGPASLGRHPLPDVAAFQALLGRLGITPDVQVVAYDAADGALAAARLWWLLKLSGQERVAVLDGGVARWQTLGLPMDASPPPAAVAAYPRRFDAAQVVGTDEVLARLGEPAGWLLDARAPERFRGETEPLDPVAGHIPGALNRPYAANLDGGRMLAPEVLKHQFETLLGGRRPGDVVLSCGSGVTACHNLLAMAHAGLPGARIYAPSWSGWVSDRSRPVATGD